MKPSRIIELVEWGRPKRVDLSPNEAQALQSLCRVKRIAADWLGPTTAMVSGRGGYVGIAALSKDTQIIIRPHIPISNVLELTCYAYGLTPPDNTFIGDAHSASTGPADWLGLLFTMEVERLLALGLRAGYQEIEEDVPYIRGRIDFGTLRWGDTKLGLVPCRFEDFIVDTNENRILRGTLEILSTSGLSPIYRRRVDHALDAFRKVSFVRLTRRMFKRTCLNRLNAYYQSALTLSQLVLESAGIDLESGDVSSVGFFFPMSEVFEKALERALRDEFGSELKSQPEYGHSIRCVAGEPAIPITFRPDNVIGPRDAPWVIVDAKYKTPLIEHHGKRFRNPDIYQAFMYATALSAPAILVYPKVDQDIDVTLKVGNNEVRILTVDLRLNGGIQKLRQKIANIAGSVA